MKQYQYYCMRYYVTYRCNSRCSYCNVWQDKRYQTDRELTKEEAKDLIRQCYEAGVRYIDFTGGEPGLYENLADLIRYAKSLGIKTEVTTNGLSALPGRLEEIAGCADKFNLSLDTLNAETYQLVRGVNGLDQAMETLKRIRLIRCPKVMMVISENNIGELERMISFAQQIKAEIYLNPEFTYFERDRRNRSADFIERITEKIYEPYTVIMLHFMEFYRRADSDKRPSCSANIRTLSFAPDGSLILPCYHDLQEMIPWNGNVADMLKSERFLRYSEADDRETCKHCTVIPYFGISFNYCLNDYFLIQSYSEKLNHLKRDFLNGMPGFGGKSDHLLLQLKELLRIALSLNNQVRDHTSRLYWAQKTELGYMTDLYREPLTEIQYQKELRAQDCWQLELVPHAGFDVIYEQAYRSLYVRYLSGDYPAVTAEIFKDAPEFQLRWWKWFISRYMQVSVVCDYPAEESWLENYLHKILNCGKEIENAAVVHAAEKLLGMVWA